MSKKQLSSKPYKKAINSYNLYFETLYMKKDKILLREVMTLELKLLKFLKKKKII